MSSEELKKLQDECHSDLSIQDFNNMQVPCIGFDQKKLSTLVADLGRFSEKNNFRIKNIVRKLSGEPNIDLPVLRIPLNRSKIFFPPNHFPLVNSGFTQKELFQRASKLRRDNNLRAIFTRALDAAQDLYDDSDSLEERIFEGFCSPRESRFINEFNAAPALDKFAVIGAFKHRMASNRLIKLAYRVCAMAYPETFEPSTLESFHSWCLNRILGDESFEKSLIEVEKIIESEKDPHLADRMIEFRDYLLRIRLCATSENLEATN